ncbi:MAG: hypothetical protein AB8H86_32085 [Polyangiales bacterium]
MKFLCAVAFVSAALMASHTSAQRSAFESRETAQDEWGAWDPADPMQGLSLAGPRAQVGLAFSLAIELAVPVAINIADSGASSRSLNIGLGVGAAAALGLGIWGIVRLAERRRARRQRWNLLPPDLAMRQRDVRLVGPVFMLILGGLTLGTGMTATGLFMSESRDPAALLVGLPFFAIGALLMGIGGRRMRERKGLRASHRVLRAHFIGNGIAW